MQQHDRRAIGRTFVEEVHAQRRGVACRHVNVVRYERIAFQVFESGVWGSQHIHIQLLR